MEGFKPQFVTMYKFLSHFSFDTSGAKEIVRGSQARRKSLREFAKRKRRKRISRSAEREEAYAASTAQTFEKV